MIKKDHQIRDIAIIIIAAYFCAQSYYIVLKMWTSLDFNDKVNAMETVILTTVVLCEALEILYFYKFDDIKSEMYTGELFGLERQIQYKYGDQAVFRGRSLIRASIERHRRLKEKRNRRFSKNDRPKNGVKTAEREDIFYKGSKSSGVGLTLTTYNQSISTSNVDNIVMNEQSSLNFVNDANKTNYPESINCISSDDNNSNVGYTEENYQRKTIHGNVHESHNYFGSINYITSDDTAQDLQELSESFTDDVENPYGRFTKYENYSEIELAPTSSGDKRNLKQFFHDKSVKIIEELLSNNLTFTRAGLTLLKGLSVALLLVPLHGFISYMLGFIEFHELKFTFMVYVPFTGNSSPGNLAQFVGISVVQTMYIYLFYMLAIDSFLLESLSNTTLKTEIKLFLNNLEEFDAMFCAEKLDDNDNSLKARLRKLKIFERLGHIVVHHQIIFRKNVTFCDLIRMNIIYNNAAICLELCIALFLLVQLLNSRRKISTFKKLIGNETIIFHSALCVEMCISFFLAIQGDFFFKVKYTMAALCLGLALALYSQEGQDIEDGFEEVRHALYRISWHNMSLSLRKSFLVLLTRHSLPPKVTGSYGIFVINRRNLSMIMRASYSYLNFLNQFKRG